MAAWRGVPGAGGSQSHCPPSPYPVPQLELFHPRDAKEEKVHRTGTLLHRERTEYPKRWQVIPRFWA